MHHRRRTLSAALVVTIGIALVGLSCRGSSGGKKKKGNGGSAPAVACGDLVSGMLDGKGSAVPDFKDGSATAFFVVPEIPEGTAAVTITVNSTAGDADLHIAEPGARAGSQKAASYIFASQEAGPASESVRISLAGIDGVSSSLLDPTLQDYIDAGRRIPFAVFGVTAGTAFDVQVACDTVSPIPCGLDVAASVPGSGQAPPDFGGTEVLFFEVGPLPMSSGTVSILASTLSGDANLYLGRPGLTGPSASFADYVFSSTASTSASTSDHILIDGTGLHDVFGATNPTIVLGDYLVAGTSLFFAVAGLEPENEFALRVTCSDVDPIACGDLRLGSVNGSAQAPPDLSAPLETRFFQIDAIPSTTESFTLTLDSTSGDADLWIGAPGAIPGSGVASDYVFASEERGAALTDEIVLDAAGFTGIGGGTSVAYTIDDYIIAGGPLAIAVTGYDPMSDFTLGLACTARPNVLTIGCGDASSFAIPGAGRPPDFTNFARNLWFELDAIPPGTGRIDISITQEAGNVDLYLAAPDVIPGSQVAADYVVSSQVNFWEDTISICDQGSSGLFGSSSSPTISDYVNATERLSFVVAGVAASTTFTVQVTCTPAAIVVPTLIDCGDVVPDSVMGNPVLPPDFGDPVSVHHFEVPVASIQGRTAVSLRIDFTSGGDADIYLQAPGTTPGSTCNGEYIFQDISGGQTDWIRIRNSGLDVSNGGTSTAATLADYQAASTNISFAVVGWTNAAYDVSIICN